MNAIVNRPIQDSNPLSRIDPVVQNRDNPRYENVVDTLVSPNATQEQRDRAYDIVAGIETRDQVCYTDEALTQKAAEALAADKTIPLEVSEVAPLVPPGTALGPFDSADAAASAMLDYANPISKQQNLENGGLIFQDPETGKYFVSTPMGGDGDSFAPGQVPVPDGMSTVASYHCHADYSREGPNGQPERVSDPADDEYNSDNFSEQDKSLTDAGIFGTTAYLGTPSGTYRKYDSATGQDTALAEAHRPSQGGRFIPRAY